jgi:signal transduction histidine kinase
MRMIGLTPQAVLVPLALLLAPVPAWADGSQTLDRARAAMVSDPRDVIRLVATARRELPAGAALERTRADWLEAEALGRLGELDKAQALSARALSAITATASGGKLHADILMTRGAIALDQSRVKDAFALFRQAHAIFHRLKETRSEAIALQNIGTIYGDAGDQRRVLRYYAQAAEVHSGDPALAQAAANNLGTAYRALGDYPRADASFRRALALARDLHSPVLEARALNNLAAVSLLRGRLAEAERFADRGLAIAADPSVREWAPFLWGVKAQVAMARGNLPRAIALFGRTFSGVDLAKTPFFFRDFHESAADAYRRAGDSDLALRHLAAFKRLDDEAREIRSSTNAALAAAQFDFSGQELRIARLREGQLERDVQIERARARQQWLLLAATLALLAITLAAFLWVRRSRNETRAANRELETTNLALDHALKAKSEFLATTSHEIRTPLNGILGMTQVLLRRRGVEPAVVEQVRLIDSAGNMMKAIVDDILDMSQIERGEVQVERSRVDLPALVRDTAGLWQASAAEKGLALTLDLAEAPALIAEDERKLRQILFNLLSNAVKFTLDGTIAVRVGVANTGGAERLIVAIADSGIGIAPDQLDAIFEPFRQADGSTARRFGGTGLGLAICTRLAEALGGGIAVSSAPDIGSTFTLSLPLTRIEEAHAADADDRPRVLVIEPNPLFASMINACLAERHFVEIAGDLTAAKAAAAKGAADIVLLRDGADAQAVAAARAAHPHALISVFGRPAAGAGEDGAIERRLPPVHLAPALAAMRAAGPLLVAAA